jgi:hypothetical protein
MDLLTKALQEKFGHAVILDPKTFMTDEMWAEYREFIKSDQQLMDRLGLVEENGKFTVRASEKICPEKQNQCQFCGKQQKVMTRRDNLYMIRSGCCEMCYYQHKQ